MLDLNAYAVCMGGFIFGALWIYLNLEWINPGEIAIWQAILLLLLFPLMVMVGFLADIGVLGYHTCGWGSLSLDRSHSITILYL